MKQSFNSRRLAVRTAPTALALQAHRLTHTHNVSASASELQLLTLDSETPTMLLLGILQNGAWVAQH